MSKLYINDLEKIKNGKLLRLNFKENKISDEEINLTRVNNWIKDLRYIRNYILDNFKQDAFNELKKFNNKTIGEEENIDFDHRMLFLNNNLFLNIPTILGDTSTLVSKNGIVSASLITSELENKVEKLMPYIKNLLKLNEESNVLDNSFYQDLRLFNALEEANLVINGDGIFLPFRDYEMTNDKLQELLSYYYTNSKILFDNIKVPNSKLLEQYRTNTSKQKALAIYKGTK